MHRMRRRGQGHLTSIRKDLRSTYTGHLGSSLSRALCVQAFSTWHITDKSCCGLVKEEKRNEDTRIATDRYSSTIPCAFGGDCFRQWIMTTGEKRDKPNYLGILALDWYYVPSAHLVEGQGEDAKMIYTSSKATQYHQKIKHVYTLATTVDISKVGEDVSR